MLFSSIVAATTYIPHLSTLSAAVIRRLFDDDHSDWCEVILHCSFMCIYTYTSHLLHPSVDGHLGCFYVLAVVNSAAVNTSF